MDGFPAEIPGYVEAKIARRRHVLDEIKNELIDRLQLEYLPADIDDDTFLFGTGLALDSIDAMEIVIGIEARFGVLMPDGDIASLRTLNTLADFVISETGTQDAATQ